MAPTNPIAAELEKLAPSIEKEIRPRLQGLVGAILRSYLPQTWVFESPESAASLTVSPEGAASVAPRALPKPDVAIRAKQEVLLRALSRGSRAGVHESDFEVQLPTSKGKAAFGFLRQRFGL